MMIMGPPIRTLHETQERRSPMRHARSTALAATLLAVPALAQVAPPLGSDDWTAPSGPSLGTAGPC